MDDTTALIFAAVILFTLTLLVGAVPVQLLDTFSRKTKKHYHDGAELKRYEYEDPSAEKKCGSKFRKFFSKDRVVQFLAQLGGGVLLYTALVHMLPEIRENYESYLENVKIEEDNDSNDTVKHGGGQDGDEHSGLPLVDLCACAGFFGIFLLEEVMHTFLLKNHDHHHHGGHDTEANNHKSSISRSPTFHRSPSAQFVHGHHRNSSFGDVSGLDNRQQHANGGSRSRQSSQYTSTSTVMTVSNGMLTERDPITFCKTPPPCYESCDPTDVPVDPNLNKCDVENISNFELFIAEERSTCARVFDALLMILAFSCHAIFDGISIGVQKNNKIWPVLIAILSHKLLIAFVLSMQIFERSKQLKNARLILWFFSTVFALMSPIGIFIVMVMDKTSQAPEENQLHIIILAAISAGTIIYIVFLEIIDKSSSRTHISGFVQWIALAIGFGLMHLVSVLFHED